MSFVNSKACAIVCGRVMPGVRWLSFWGDWCMKLFTILLLALVTSWGTAQDKWAAADSATLRLHPTSFSQLPGNVVQYL